MTKFEKAKNRPANDARCRGRRGRSRVTKKVRDHRQSPQMPVAAVSSRIVGKVLRRRGRARAARRRSATSLRPSSTSVNRSSSSQANLGRQLVRGELGGELVGRDAPEADVAAGGARDLGDGLGEAQQPRPGQLVELADMPVARSSAVDGDVGDVVGIDERLADIGRPATPARRRARRRGKALSLKFWANQLQRRIVQSAPEAHQRLLRRAGPPPRRGPTAAPAASRPLRRPARRRRRPLSAAPGTARSG